MKAFPAEIASLATIQVDHTDKEYIVHITVYNFGGFNSARIDYLRDYLNRHTDKPVLLKATILNAVTNDSQDEPVLIPAPAP